MSKSGVPRLTSQMSTNDFRNCSTSGQARRDHALSHCVPTSGEIRHKSEQRRLSPDCTGQIISSLRADPFGELQHIHPFLNFCSTAAICRLRRECDTSLKLSRCKITRSSSFHSATQSTSESAVNTTKQSNTDRLPSVGFRTRVAICAAYHNDPHTVPFFKHSNISDLRLSIPAFFVSIGCNSSGTRCSESVLIFLHASKMLLLPSKFGASALTGQQASVPLPAGPQEHLLSRWQPPTPF